MRLRQQRCSWPNILPFNVAEEYGAERSRAESRPLSVYSRERGCIATCTCHLYFPTAMSSAPSTSYRPPTSEALAQSSMPDHSTSTGFSRSSLVKKKIAEHFAEHNRNEVQLFAYDEDIVQLKYDEQTPFLEFLNVPDEHLSNIPKVRGKVTLRTFVKVANTTAKKVKDLCERLLLYLAPLLTFNPTCRFFQ